MTSFKNYLNADLYKFLKSKISISHFLIPIIGLILMLAYFTLSSWSEIEKVSAYIQVISMAFPLIISIVITMAYEQEEEAGFQYFLSVPNKRYIPHISKLFLLFLFICLRASAQRGGGAEGEREFQAGSMPSVEPDTGLDLTTLRS